MLIFQIRTVQISTKKKKIEIWWNSTDLKYGTEFSCAQFTVHNMCIRNNQHNMFEIGIFFISVFFGVDLKKHYTHHSYGRKRIFLLLFFMLNEWYGAINSVSLSYFFFFFFLCLPSIFRQTLTRRRMHKTKKTYCDSVYFAQKENKQLCGLIHVDDVGFVCVFMCTILFPFFCLCRCTLRKLWNCIICMWTFHTQKNCSF